MRPLGLFNYNMNAYEGKKLFLVIQLFLEEKKFFEISYNCGWMSKYSLRNNFSYWI